MLKEFNRTVGESATALGLRAYGTAGAMTVTDTLCCLPTRNFREGRFEGARLIGGEAVRDTILIPGEEP